VAREEGIAEKTLIIGVIFITVPVGQKICFITTG
jgi:hypothetical protein